MNDLEQKWNEISEKIDSMTDRLGMPVDEGIKEAVIALNCLGFMTTGSCFGHEGRETGGPWVDISSPELERKTEELHRLMGYKVPVKFTDEMQQISDEAKPFVEALEESLKEHVDKFNASSPHKIIFDNSSTSVRICYSEDDLDLNTAQELFTKFGKFLQREFFSTG